MKAAMNINCFKPHLCALTAGIITMALVSPDSHAQTITYTDLTGATAGGRVWEVTASQQVGEANFYNQAHAGLWSGSAASFTDLTPAGTFSAILNGTSGNQQVGVVWPLNTPPHAGLWTGSARSFVDLHSAGAYASEAYATSGSKQVGVTYVGSLSAHASLWSGSAASFIDLHPASAHLSYAVAISGNRQGGFAQFNGKEHAGVWSGSAASFIDLNPSGSAYSRVSAMAGNQQVGFAFQHAGLWYGSAASFVDLNPAGAVASSLEATTGDFQVGGAWFGTSQAQAGLWNGTAGSFLNLHASLGSDYFVSYATGIATNGSTIMIGGYARKTSEFGDRPILWTVTFVPEPQSLALLLLGGSILWNLRRPSRATCGRS